MIESDPDTLRPETPEAVAVCIIDADAQFSRQLTDILVRRLAAHVQVVGAYEGIPEPHEIEDHLPEIVILDPELDDFRHLEHGLKALRERFGERVIFVAHSDIWKHPLNPLRLELIAADVTLGFARYDYAAAIELISYVSARIPREALRQRFGA
ncbi:hypothetical protein EDM68_05045 [Candidatus Uhrbacteria bacterium]|nr:MAG: hypothetical protein EDM68_05045 [Candidatus Uhrbacteria bacterium]